jgi:Lon protease-like protein
MLPPPTIPHLPAAERGALPNVFLPLHIFEPRYREMVATRSTATA